MVIAVTTTHPVITPTRNKVTKIRTIWLNICRVITHAFELVCFLLVRFFTANWLASFFAGIVRPNRSTPFGTSFQRSLSLLRSHTRPAEQRVRTAFRVFRLWQASPNRLNTFSVYCFIYKEMYPSQRMIHYLLDSFHSLRSCEIHNS